MTWKQWDQAFAQEGLELEYLCSPYRYDDGGQATMIDIRAWVAPDEDTVMSGCWWAEVIIDNKIAEVAPDSLWKDEIEIFLEELLRRIRLAA